MSVPTSPLGTKLGPMQPVTIDTGTNPVFAGVATWVDVAGSAPVGARLQFVDGKGYAVTRRANPDENDGWSDTVNWAIPILSLTVISSIVISY